MKQNVSIYFNDGGILIYLSVNLVLKCYVKYITYIEIQNKLIDD